MGEAVTGSVLRRLARPPQGAAPPATPARVLRLALTRAAERSSGLGLSVLGVAEEVMGLDALMSITDPQLMLLSVQRGEAILGFAGIDLELRTALIEAQTIGRLRPQAAEPRPVTATDVALAQPLASALLVELARGGADSPLNGWVTDHRIGTRLPGLQAVEAVLGDGPYRVLRATVDLGVGERQGALIVAIALPPAPVPARPPEAPRFAEALQANVLAAETEIHAVLHRLQLPIGLAEQLAVGQILPLPGVTVGSVRLEAMDGQVVGRGRLGHSVGLRAVRVEQPGRPGLSLASPGQGLLGGAGNGHDRWG